jgi:antitoxin component HigA of HigAB toxin-antitoxin module
VREVRPDREANSLSDLVETYEAEHYPMAKVSDARMVRHLMEAKGVNQTEVAQATGIANSTISAVWKGARQLTREHIGQLAIFFHVDPGVFIFGGQEGPRKKPARRMGFCPGRRSNFAALTSIGRLTVLWRPTAWQECPRGSNPINQQ